MNEHAIRKILEGGGGPGGTLVRAGLWLPGKLYGSLMELRRTAYRCGMLDSFRPGVPVISVGNLTAGGSGKTPFTIMLARQLLAMGKKPGILLRGYRQSTAGLSDEAVLYSRHCPGAVVEVGADRRESARRAVAAGAGVLLLDDGMQHLRLKRDLDIVLVDATAPWGGGNTIPGGLLREPKSALMGTGAVVVTRSNQVNKETVDRLRAEIASLAPGALVLTARHQPSRLLRLDGVELPLDALANRRVVALSGIARPEAFGKTLSELGAVVVATVAGADHDHFSPELLHTTLNTAEQMDAVVVTTEKDRAKQIFSDLADKYNVEGKRDIWTLGIEQEVDDKDALAVILGRVAGL